ncbi:MAG: Phenylacetic acid catabolic protein [Pseudomonadota bacterium]
MQPAASPPSTVYRQGDPAMPAEFRDMLIKLLLDAHLENNGNPEYRKILGNIANAGLRFAPHGRAMEIEAEIVKQEVRHGQIVADLIEGLGANPNQVRPIKQYAFHIPFEDWIDLAWFHALIDRVGLYVGIELTAAPYEPLVKAAPELEGDEEFHTRAGFLHLEEICATPEGKAAAQERLGKWWPAALDMFGRSDSRNAPVYVKWGIKTLDNEALRRKYIAEAIPEIEKLGLQVPDNLANRRFL